MTGVIRGDALHLPLGDETVDLIITSPPYFALRSYRDGGVHYDGQIGSEPTPQAFLEALWAVTAECWRVLKPSGSLFVNLGDKRAGSGGGNQNGLASYKGGGLNSFTNQHDSPRRYNQAAFGRTKSKMLLPHRYAIGCEDGLADPDGVGWIVRSDMVWCLSGGAKVYARTPTGDRPIMVRDLARHYQPDAVQLWNGERWTQVLGWSMTPTDGDALELELRSGERIGCTRNHEWPTTRGLVRADQLVIGDVIQTATLPEPRTFRRARGLPAPDVGWFVGLYLAEGSRSEATIQIAGHVNETVRHARLAAIADRYDGTCAVYQTSDNGVTCNLTGSVLLGIIDRYVSRGTAHTKRLTLATWQRDNDFLRAVMDGYLDGDGSYDAKNDRWRLGFTRNDDWASDLRTIAARLDATLTLKRGTAWGFGQPWDIWRGEWRWTATTHHNTKPRTAIVAIRASRARYFYDIGVADEPHLFTLASGVLTHNSKPNGLPESVRDRVRDSHEYWFHLTKRGDYYAAVDEIREAQKDPDRGFSGRSNGTIKPRADRDEAGYTGMGWQAETLAFNPLGKLPGSVWTIPSEPLTVPAWVGVDHFAAFPQEFPRRLILGWSPSGICTVCGEGRRPVVDKQYDAEGRTTNGPQSTAQRFESPGRDVRMVEAASIVGYACGCTRHTDHAAEPYILSGTEDTMGTHPPRREYHLAGWTPPPTRPAVVLDPFVGTGTVPMVARALGRIGIGVNLSWSYCTLARWRIFDSGHAAKTLERTNDERQGTLL